MPTDLYAKSVVNQLLRKTPKHWIGEGSYIWLMWFFWTFMPKTFLVRSPPMTARDQSPLEHD